MELFLTLDHILVQKHIYSMKQNYVNLKATRYNNKQSSFEDIMNQSGKNEDIILRIKR